MEDYLKSFLKWPGGKFRLLPHILPLLPKAKRLIEPFAGSAVVFLNTPHQRGLLCDQNADLINLFNLLKHDHNELVDYARSFCVEKNNNAERYYQFRDQFNASECQYERAALFIYLNRHGYNGLCRYNNKGYYNVPFGRYKRPYFPEKELQHFSARLRHAIIKKGDFRRSLAQAKAGDVIYCDPPYVPLSPSANFTAYSPGSFSLQDQHDLAGWAEKCADKGCTVVVSNHDVTLTRSLYRHAKIFPIQVRRFISCNPQKRGMITELLALWEPR